MADPAPDTEAVVSKQLHYYFSPSNLFRDKFLVKQQQENDGWVEIATLLKFNRLVTKGGTAENILAIAEQSDAFQVSEDKAKILGNTVAATKAEVEARSLYVKGFPKDDAVTTIEMIEEFFASHGTVLSVQIRRYKDKDGAWQPKGAAFVEFGTPEEAATVLAKVIPYEGVNLVFETVPAYWARKKEERDAAQKKRKEKKGGNRPLPEMPEYEEGIVIKGTNVGEGLNREDLKDAFGLYGNVAWVFFNRGEEEFHIKYKTAAGATTCLAQMGEAERTFGGVVAEISALNPEEERALLQASWAETHEKRRGKRGARGGGGGRGAKRKRDDDETEATAVAAGEAPATEEPAPKKAAAESSDGTPAKAPAPADA